VSEWWISDGPLPGGEWAADGSSPVGTKVLGPFMSPDLAHEVRGLLEREGEATFWIDTQLES